MSESKWRWGLDWKVPHNSLLHLHTTTAPTPFPTLSFLSFSEDQTPTNGASLGPRTQLWYFGGGKDDASLISDLMKQSCKSQLTMRNAILPCHKNRPIKLLENESFS